MKATNKKSNLMTLTMGAVLTATVIVLQMLGQFIHLGPFSVSLVLVPIIVGAAMCGPLVSMWLGFIFGVVVLMTDAAAFLAISVPGTIVTVLLKGALCGLAAGLIYKTLAKVNQYFAVIVSAIACPIVNTGIFLIGCRLFFYDTISQWGMGAGFDSPVKYMLLGLVGGNFLFELGINIILCPAIVRILRIKIR
ncbi:MAG: energy-coupled thiamine transporter ThiT [Clostridia bacterium]|nr:energy-coupled thiamine transporter ThiT [Clostridia bacterium]